MINIWALIAVYIVVIVLGASIFGIKILVSNLQFKAKNRNKYQDIYYFKESSFHVIDIGVYFLVCLALTVVIYGFIFL